MNNNFLFLLILINICKLNTYDAKASEFSQQIRAIVLADEENEKKYMGNIIQKKEKILCISLGFNCTVAKQLDINKLRQLAFPFDWIVTPFEGLYDIIDNDFNGFLKPENLKRIRTNFITNIKYNIAFVHDFPLNESGEKGIVFNYLDFLEPIQKKYQRRIERFQRCMEFTDTVYFIRVNNSEKVQDKNSVIKLRDLLMQKFPSLNLTLVVIDTDATYKNDWNLYKIKNIQLQNPQAIFYLEYSQEWAEIFRTLGLIQ